MTDSQRAESMNTRHALSEGLALVFKPASAPPLAELQFERPEEGD